MNTFDTEKNKLYIGATNKLDQWILEGINESKIIEKIQLLLKYYLELDNVSFLFGSGTSIHLGAAAIRDFPIEVEESIKETELYDDFISIINSLQDKDQFFEEKDTSGIFKNENGWNYIKDKNNIFRDIESKEISIEYEKVLNYLIACDYVFGENKQEKRTDRCDELITIIKQGLFNVCNVDKRNISDKELERIKVRGKEKAFNDSLYNKYLFHEKFVKALLQRPLNLRRANIFTTNYDLAFEYAFDQLGVHYIDGFAGFHKRLFKPETFEHDIFYPGSTTSGKVQRIEKVVRYYKLHGSLSWISSDKRNSNNIYGIEEKTLELIEQLEKKGEIIIYPSAVKKSYTLDLPYSELFRQFASTITQSQSVLITVGYAFADEHLNDIIFQALSSPTFTLIIVDFSGTKNKSIEKLRDINDPRIIILEGNFLGDFLSFSDTLMPNFNDMDSGDRVANTLNELINMKESISNLDRNEEQNN